jgi:hypothetical protein
VPIPASSVLPDLDEVKAHLNEESDEHDDELQGMLDAACDLVAAHVGPLDTETVTDEVHPGGRSSLVLHRYPVVEVTAASYWDGTAIDVADLEVDGSTGIVSWGYNTAGWFSYGARNVRVTYTVGRATLPAPVRLAILEVARDLWSGTQSGGGGRSFGQDFADAEPAFGTAGRPALSPHVLSLLEPYLLGPTVA